MDSNTSAQFLAGHIIHADTHVFIVYNNSAAFVSSILRQIAVTHKLQVAGSHNIITPFTAQALSQVSA